MASVAVVDVVGARFIGQASLSTLTSRWTSANCARFEDGLPLMAMSLAPMRLTMGTMVSSSPVSPEFEMAMKTSRSVTMPRSPCAASAGCTKKAGVPVEASVAAILRPMWPDLPMPETTTRPSHCNNSSTARASACEPSAASRFFIARMASASICSVSSASSSARRAAMSSKALGAVFAWVTLMPRV